MWQVFLLCDKKVYGIAMTLRRAQQLLIDNGEGPDEEPPDRVFPSASALKEGMLNFLNKTNL